MNDHRIPAIDRAFDVLDSLAREPGGSIAQITEALGVPRSTIYRILNSLEARGIVVRDSEGGYRLGPQLIRLAGAVPKGVDIVAMARPHLESLASSQSATVKLSVLDHEAALVVAVAESPKSYSVTTKVGSRFPLHAGAASKALLAATDTEFQDRYLRGPLPAVTHETIVDPDQVRQMLVEIRQRGYSEDHGEYAEGVSAVSAPVFGPDGQCVCAVSIPYLSSVDSSTRDRLRQAVMDTAKTLSRQLGGQSLKGTKRADIQ